MTGIKRFQSRRTEIDAVLFKGDNHAEIAEFLGESDGGVLDDGKAHGVETVNGLAQGYAGTWFIKGPVDFYPCDPITFEDRWEEI